MAMLLSYALLVLCDLLYDGAGMQNILFSSELDTGMDFFSSIQYTNGGVPYTKYGTVYPPLANLLFYCICVWLPNALTQQMPTSMYDIMMARGTSVDLRVNRNAMMAFLLFLLLTAALYLILSCKVLGTNRFCVPLSLIFSYGFLYGYERGNIVLVACLLTLFFLKCFSAEQAWLRELALLSLAIAAGIKLYPAVFGVLLLYQKQYKRAFRLAIYGVICLVLPAFLFEGLDALRAFAYSLIGFSTNDAQVFTYLGLQGVMKAVFYGWGRFMLLFGGTAVDLAAYTTFFAAVQKISYFFALLLVLVAWKEPKKWRKFLDLTLAMITVQQAGVYALCFLTIPMLYFLNEEKTLIKTNVVQFVLLLLLLLPFPILGLRIPIEGFPPYTWKTLTLQMAYSGLVLVSFADGIGRWVQHSKIKNREDRKTIKIER